MDLSKLSGWQKSSCKSLEAMGYERSFRDLDDNVLRFWAFIPDHPTVVRAYALRPNGSILSVDTFVLNPKLRRTEGLSHPNRALA